MIFEIAIFSCC